MCMLQRYFYSMWLGCLPIIFLLDYWDFLWSSTAQRKLLLLTINEFTLKISYSLPGILWESFFFWLYQLKTKECWALCSKNFLCLYSYFSSKWILLLGALSSLCPCCYYGVDIVPLSVIPVMWWYSCMSNIATPSITTKSYLFIQYGQMSLWLHFCFYDALLYYGYHFLWLLICLLLTCM